MARRRKSKKIPGGELGALLAVAFVLAAVAPGYALDVPWTFLLVGLGGIVAAAWLLRQLATPTAPGAKELYARFGAAGAMSGAEFELFVADVFGAMGHRARVVGGSGDQGVDVIVDLGGERVAVQCKNHGKPVGNRAVQQVYAGARHHGCSQAWAVAPAGFTEGAKALARSTGVALFDGAAIGRWIERADRAEGERTAKNRPPESARQEPWKVPATEAVRRARAKAYWHPHPDDPPRGTSPR